MKTNLKFSILATLATFTLGLSPLYAQEKADLTLQDKLSYSLGIKAGRSLGRDILQQGLDKNTLDLEMLTKGIQQGLLENSKPLLSDAELRNVFIEFQQQRQKKELTSQQLNLIAALLATYHLDTGEYPTSLEELLSNVSNNKYWHGPYLEDKGVLTDPWGHAYQYRYPGLDKKYGMYNYDLFSFGADGSLGGLGENADVLWEMPAETSSTPASPTPPQPKGGGKKAELPADKPSVPRQPIDDNALLEDETTLASSSLPPPLEDKKKFHTLVINYQRESWTRVADLRGKELYTGIAKAGGQISVSGVPPFELKFGVTDGITIEYEGEKLVLEKQPNLKNKRITIGVADP